MHEQLIRTAFSALAAAVFLATAQEWATWGIERHEYWRFVPTTVLTIFALYETHKVWVRVESLLGL